MKIRALRKSAGLTQDDLAKKCGTTQQQIAKLEMGVTDPKVSTLEKVAAALACDVKDLFYSRSEFLETIRSGVTTLGLDLAKHSVIDVNYFLSREFQVPTFHPLWERVQIKQGQLVFKEDL